MNNKREQKNKLAKRTLQALKSEYVVIGKTSIRKWHAWLILGIMVGIITGIVFIANRSGTFDKIFAAQAPIGWLETIDSKGLVTGWALDPDSPASSILVHAYVDGPAGVGKLIGGLPASLSRPDVNEVMKVTGNHGFEFLIPSQFRDGTVHTLFIHGIDTSGDGSQNLLLSGVPKSFSLPPVAKDNGVIKINFFEGGFPMITSMSIYGKEVLSHDNAGADLQMNARIDSDVLNPTQGGDCRGVPSRLTGLLSSWSGAGIGIDSSNGVLLGIDPRNYGLFYGCEKFGEITPYNFNFGVTLGNGKKFPKEMLILDMAMQREEGSRYIPKKFTEMPVGFFNTSIMRFAYGSLDGNEFLPITMAVASPNGATTQEKDVSLWPADTLKNKKGKVVMLCDNSKAIEFPNKGFCMAFFSNFETTYELSHRKTEMRDLVLMNMTGSNEIYSLFDDHSWIRDLNWQILRRVIAVGNFNTIKRVVAIAKLRITDWGNW